MKRKGSQGTLSNNSEQDRPAAQVVFDNQKDAEREFLNRSIASFKSANCESCGGRQDDKREEEAQHQGIVERCTSWFARKVDTFIGKYGEQLVWFAFVVIVGICLSAIVLYLSSLFYSAVTASEQVEDIPAWIKATLAIAFSFAFLEAYKRVSHYSSFSKV